MEVNQQTASSDAADQSSFEMALAAALAAEAAAAPTPVKAPAAPVETASTAPAPVAPVSTDSTPPAPSAKELERIAALDAREAKVREAEARAKAVDAREAELKAREASQWESFYRDPVGHVRRMRPDLNAAEAAQVAERFYFDALGDKAPPEHKQRQEVAKVTTEVRSEVDQLRAELQELRDARSREQELSEVAKYRAELRAQAADIADAPIVQGLAKRNPARLEELLFEVARRAAIESKQSGAAEPVVLTGAQAAAQLEALLKAQRDELYGPAPVEAQAQNVTKSSPSPTLSNKDASIQPQRSVPDDLDDDVLRKAALKAAGVPESDWY